VSKYWLLWPIWGCPANMPEKSLKVLPSQINLVYPGGEPYFYSNPWPFAAEQLLDKPLPDGAAWHTEGWQGSTLAYKELVEVS
jgi:hypothetical protein